MREKQAYITEPKRQWMVCIGDRLLFLLSGKIPCWNILINPKICGSHCCEATFWFAVYTDTHCITIYKTTFDFDKVFKHYVKGNNRYCENQGNITNNVIIEQENVD
jgi:hypothetical protein